MKTIPEPKRYRAVKEVIAEPIIEHDFLMKHGRPVGPLNINGHRKGYKITDQHGRISWMAKERFEEEFLEIKGNR